MHSYARGAAYGWVNVSATMLPKQFLNKKITIETLSEHGNTIESYELTDADKDSLLTALYAKYGVALLLDECYPDLFSQGEMKIAIKTLETLYNIVPSDEEIKQVRSLLDRYGQYRLSFALDMSESSRHHMGQAFLVSPKSPYFSKHYTFDEAIEFLSVREGVYYAVNSDGIRCYDFIDKPTKKQISHQVKKNGNRIAFLSFQDGKEYEADKK
ncbi:hypothetical protein J2W97_002405 [Paenibacillus jamilae]|nr:hypothetical protein [Paenibacillus jamilae]